MRYLYRTRDLCQPPSTIIKSHYSVQSPSLRLIFSFIFKFSTILSPCSPLFRILGHHRPLSRGHCTEYTVHPLRAPFQSIELLQTAGQERRHRGRRQRLPLSPATNPGACDDSASASSVPHSTTHTPTNPLEDLSFFGSGVGLAFACPSPNSSLPHRWPLFFYSPPHPLALLGQYSRREAFGYPFFLVCYLPPGVVRLWISALSLSLSPTLCDESRDSEEPATAFPLCASCCIQVSCRRL